MTTASEFQSFNARALPASVIARTFIAPSQFVTLTRVAHSVIVGPRGSGKTTLLKMLTPEALTDLNAQTSLAGLPVVPFTGVFVPTDISWSRQLAAFRELHLDDSYAAAFVRSSFTTAVLRAFVNALLQRLAAPESPALLRVAPLRLEPEEEATLVALLADAWRVEVRIKSLLGLRIALSNRLVALAEFALVEERMPPERREVRFAENRDLDLPLLPSLTSALDALEAVAPQVIGERWALLFDELELAPAEIRSELLQSLRSVDDRLLFKLSLSPFSDEFAQFSDALSAMPGHDHDEVSLSYGRKEHGVAFSLELMAAIMRRNGYEGVGAALARRVLGESLFPDSGTMVGDESDVTRSGRYFRALYASDSSFKEYADKHGGSLDGYLSLEGDKRAQFVRKVAPIVIVRATFRVTEGSRVYGARRFKSRKNPDIYRGATSLATLLEGNPRYIIGVMNGLLSETPGRVSGSRQTAEVAKTANRFRALLTTIPAPQVLAGGRRALLSLVDEVGEFFRQAVIADEFSPDPPGTFIVDSTASDSLIAALAQLVNAGALIFVPDPDGGAIMTSLRGKRLRLNYLLASQYGLPLRLERPVALSRVLESRDRRSRAPEQATLFGEQG